MNALTERIKLRILTGHRGRARAIKRADLAEKFGISERTLRKHLTELVEDHGYPIARTDDGIYLCVTDEERKENFRRYEAMARSNWRQARAFERASERQQKPQGELFG